MNKMKQYYVRGIFLKTSFLFLNIFFFSHIAYAGTLLKGNITDSKTGEALPGASIAIKGTSLGTISDFSGNFELGLTPGKYNLAISFISYTPIELNDVEIKNNETTFLEVRMEESTQALQEVVVMSMRQLSSEVAMLNTIRNSTSIASGVSAQQISKSQDRDASEAIRRIPGISIIEDRFIVTRGLAQRYNNVWINNSAVPSSESDTRSFSFDIIPSSQLENIMVIKSPQPELLADFSGGFVKIMTKSVPNENSMQISYGMGINTSTQFQDFKYSKGSGTDLLGFDNGMRRLRPQVPNRMDNDNAQQVTDLTRNGFNNDWSVKTKKPLPDQRLSFVLNRRFQTKNNKIWGLSAAVNYSNSDKTYRNMENSRFGVYSSVEDRPVYTNKYTDNQYSSDVRVGAIANVVFMPNAQNKFEFRNMLNQLAKNRYTERAGYMYLSGYYDQKKAEYVYNTRFTYSGQLAGTHNFSENSKLDWTGGFSYANRNQPDRRIINMEENTNPEDLYNGLYGIEQNDISRDFLALNEYVYSLTTNYEHKLNFGNFNPTIKAGLYGEYKDRDYKHRLFYYRWIEQNMPDDFPYRDVVSEVLIPENFASDKLYIYEDTDNRNSYSGKNKLLAGYLAFNIPVGKFNLYAGLRAEYNKMSLISYTSIRGSRTITTDYPTADLFPSANATYNFNEKNLLRIAYGKSINRQEFREVSASVYEDFDLFGSIKGNPNLKPAYIQNFDIRYELYPSNAELISVAIFYKNFKDPIEWIYRDAGGSYIYSFENAKSANNYGLEVDIKKNLGFMGLKDFSFNFNGALIKSLVEFDENSLEHDRPMQGQSPFLINTGLFYQNEKIGLNMGILYNIIGKRIVGIGRIDTSEGGSINNDIPDMYEMPRNVLDFTITKKWKSGFELSAAVRDIICQPVVFKQFPKFIDNNGVLQEREQITKQYDPGRNILVTARYNF